MTTVVRIARWAAERGVERIVDIGSGVGKFCIAAALARSGLSLVGLEQRPRLTVVARTLARAFEVEDRVRFVQGVLGEAELPVADAYYLYNPFGENFLDPDEHIDRSVEVGMHRHARDLAALKAALRQARVGTYVLTYYGCGGRLPSGYEEVDGVDCGVFSMLEVWRKAREA